MGRTIIWFLNLFVREYTQSTFRFSISGRARPALARFRKEWNYVPLTGEFYRTTRFIGYVDEKRND